MCPLSCIFSTGALTLRSIILLGRSYAPGTPWLTHTCEPLSISNHLLYWCCQVPFMSGSAWTSTAQHQTLPLGDVDPDIAACTANSFPQRQKCSSSAYLPLLALETTFRQHGNRLERMTWQGSQDLFACSGLIAVNWLSLLMSLKNP